MRCKIRSPAHFENSSLSVFHMNIHSLNKNNEGLCQFLNTLNHDFDVLVLSEIWSCNIALYNKLLPGYDFYYDLPLVSDVGGVGIYVRSNILHCIVSSYKIVSSIECPLENLWIDVTKNSNRYIIGGIYRHPGHKISNFTEKLDNILTQISNCKIPCFIAGDINIDLKKSQYHQDTKRYLDTLIVNNFTPVVVMPTRITDKSATLIDHIYYSDCSKRDTNNIITGGNLWCDLTDHLPNFAFLSNNRGAKYDYTRLPLVRLHSPKNIEEFVKSMNSINWNNLHRAILKRPVPSLPLLSTLNLTTVILSITIFLNLKFKGPFKNPKDGESRRKTTKVDERRRNTAKDGG